MSNPLKGNLAHKTFEQLFKAIIETNNEHWNKEKIEDWVAEYIPGLLEREGAVLLLYGLEPQRLGFIQTVQQAAWALVSITTYFLSPIINIPYPPTNGSIYLHNSQSIDSNKIIELTF